MADVGGLFRLADHHRHRCACARARTHGTDPSCPALASLSVLRRVCKSLLGCFSAQNTIADAAPGRRVRERAHMWGSVCAHVRARQCVPPSWCLQNEAALKLVSPIVGNVVSCQPVE